METPDEILFLVIFKSKFYLSMQAPSSFDGATLVGNPENVLPFTYQCEDGSTVGATNGAAPSALFVTYGYSSNNFGKYLGFDLWIYNDFSVLMIL